MLNPDLAHQDFPFFNSKIGSSCVYFDNGATTQKPQTVLDSIIDFYKNFNANTGRSSHSLASKADQIFWQAREDVANFLNAKPQEIIFNSGATEGFNQISLMLEEFLSPGDEIILTNAEHHSNLLPWQSLAKKKGAKLVFIDYTKIQKDNFDEEYFKSFLSGKTKIVTLPQVSNVLGGEVDLESIGSILDEFVGGISTFPVGEGLSFPKKQTPKIRDFDPLEGVILADSVKPFLIVDGSQGVAHSKIDLTSSKIDFYVFSGHKVYAPMGIGVCFISSKIQNLLKPSKLGGGMVKKVTQNSFIPADSPFCFEAGTPNVAGAAGLAEALKYIQKIGLQEIQKHEQNLTKNLIQNLSKIQNLKIHSFQNSSLVSFSHSKISSSDIGQMLDSKGFLVRSGLHCASPLHSDLKVEGTVRVSFAIYNTLPEVEKFCKSLVKVIGFLESFTD